MINLVKTFKEYLKDINVVSPTYSAMLTNGVIPAPSLTTTVVKGSIQRRSNTSSQINLGQYQADTSVIYVDANSMPAGPSYYTFGGNTLIMTEMPIDIATLLDCYKINTYTPNYITSNWSFNNAGSAVGGAWVPGGATTLSATYMFWDPVVSASDFTRSFIANFDYTADMLYAITHPASAVPPVGSTTTISGTTVKVMHRSEERHRHALGHILTLKRMTT